MILCQLLGISDRKALLSNGLGQGDRIRRRHQCARMTRRKASVRQHVTDRIR